MEIPFVKLQAAGNDFILVDEFEGLLVPESEKSDFVAMASDRHFGIGSDGVIFVQPSDKHDVKFMFYNPDGSLAEMCGNGMRCFVKYVYEKGIARKERIEVESLKGLIVAEPILDSGLVMEARVDMGAPFIKRAQIPVSGDPEASFIDQEVGIDGGVYRITAVGMGNPHAVLFSESIFDVDIDEVGGRIRYLDSLFPNGANVHLVEDVGRNEFNIRTYERGVEGETLACGTGICASAVALYLNGIVDGSEPLLFHAMGGDLLVELCIDSGAVEGICLTGPVCEVFRGVI